VQVEAATGGEDVVRFCGGLSAVLAAAAIPLQKALPCADLPNAGHTTSPQPAHAAAFRAVETMSCCSMKLQTRRRILLVRSSMPVLLSWEQTRD